MWGRWKLGRKSVDQNGASGGAKWGGAKFVPTHRHKKGGLYRVLGRGVLEADLTPVVIYDDAEGRIWVRPVAEFDDGRFQPFD